MNVIGLIELDSMIATHAVEMLTEELYRDYTTTPMGLARVIEALAAENDAAFTLLAMRAGLIRGAADEIQTDAVIAIIGSRLNSLSPAKRQMFFAIDEMASRLAGQRAEEVGRMNFA